MHLECTLNWLEDWQGCSAGVYMYFGQWLISIFMPEYWIQWVSLWEHFPKIRNSYNQGSLFVSKFAKYATNESNSPPPPLFFSSDDQIAESNSGKLLCFLILFIKNNNSVAVLFFKKKAYLPGKIIKIFNEIFLIITNTL